MVCVKLRVIANSDTAKSHYMQDLGSLQKVAIKLSLQLREVLYLMKVPFCEKEASYLKDYCRHQYSMYQDFTELPL